jgi:hypothetical protein
MTKYWKGKNDKVGQFGTMDDTGYVPDSDPATQIEYDAWIAAQPAPTPSQLQTDIAALALTTTSIQDILERMRKGER